MKDKTLHYLHATVFCRHTLGEESRSQSSKHQLHFQMSALEQNTPKKLEHTMLTWYAHAGGTRWSTTPVQRRATEKADRPSSCCHWGGKSLITEVLFPELLKSIWKPLQQLKRRYFEPGKRWQQQGQSVIPVLRACVGTYGYTGSFFTPPNSLSQMTVWGTARELLLALVHRWMGKGHSRHPIQQAEWGVKHSQVEALWCLLPPGKGK